MSEIFSVAEDGIRLSSWTSIEIETCAEHEAYKEIELELSKNYPMV